jgi:hypothetical protein
MDCMVSILNRAPGMYTAGGFLPFLPHINYGYYNSCMRAWSVSKYLRRCAFFTIVSTKIVHLAEISILAECWSKAQELRQHVGSQSQLGIAFNENELGQRFIGGYVIK